MLPHFTGEISVGVLGLLATILAIWLGQWRHHNEERDRWTRIETKVNIMFAWFSKQMPNIPADIRRFFDDSAK